MVQVLNFKTKVKRAAWKLSVTGYGLWLFDKTHASVVCERYGLLGHSYFIEDAQRLFAYSQIVQLIKSYFIILRWPLA